MNENSSGWIKAAEEKSIDLSWLYQDKKTMFRDLETLGLPRPQLHIIQPDEVETEKVDDLFEKSDYFCRLIPKQGLMRPYKLHLRTVKEFRDFVSGYDLNDYEINLVERGEVTHTIGIIVDPDCINAVVELVEGDGHELFHGKETPVHADITATGTINYRNGRKPKQEERELIYRTLKCIGGPKNPFPGYYEVSIWNGTSIKFRNYQRTGTSYAKL